MSSPFYKSLKSHVFLDVFFRSQGKGYFTTDLQTAFRTSIPQAVRNLYLRIAGRFYPPSDVLMQCCLQGERWTLMNKYEDNLHLCCTFSFPIPHMVLLKRRLKKKISSDFQKKPLGHCVCLCACAGLCVPSVRVWNCLCMCVSNCLSLCATI